MSNQNYQNYNGYSEPDYGKRYREEPSDITENYDVEESVPHQGQIPQGYVEAQPVRRPQQAGYGVNQPRRRPPQTARNDAYRRQPPQQPYYDERRRPVAYGDSYNGQAPVRPGYDRRRYDDRYASYSEYGRRPVKKKTSGGIIAVRVFAVLLLLAGLGIVGYKLFGYYTEGKDHNELKALSADMEQLYARNNSFFGWLQIPDTAVDYPVMHTPGDPEYYLHTDFDGDYSESGELFMDGSCDPYGYHYLIYGHHMFNGSMFGSLPKYGEEDYYAAHRTFRFDTLQEKGEYEVFAVFYSEVYDDSADVFKYYTLANLNDEGTYNYYVSNVKALSIYDTGITPVYGEKIVTLSTCNYHTEDGRFVVCARKIR